MVHLDNGGCRRAWAKLICAPAHLSAWVEHFWIEQSLQANSDDRDWRVVPDAGAHLIFAIDEDAASTLAKRCFLVGARTKFHDISGGPRRLTVGARLRPGAIGLLTKSSAGIFTDRAIPVEDVFGPAGRRLQDRLSNESAQTAVAYLQTFLERRFSDSAVDRRFDAAAHSSRSVASFAGELGLSTRATYSRTIDITGLTPKRMLRVLRLHRALQHANRGCQWSDVAYGCGYSDQSHLIREFCSLLGEAPEAWRARGSCRFVQDNP